MFFDDAFLEAPIDLFYLNWRCVDVVFESYFSQPLVFIEAYGEFAYAEQFLTEEIPLCRIQIDVVESAESGCLEVTDNPPKFSRSYSGLDNF